MNALIQVKTEALPSTIIESMAEYVRQSTADNTRRAYQFDLDAWAAWANQRGHDFDTINEITVAAYITDIAPSLKVATVGRRVAGLNAYLRSQGKSGVSFRNEPLKSVWAGIQKVHGAPQRRVTPITVDLLRKVLAPIENNNKGLRDKALLVLGFAGAMRRSDLVGLDFGSGGAGNGFASVGDKGLTIEFIRSKTNQTGYEEKIGIAYGSNPDTCPVRVLAAWRACLGDIQDNAPIFRPVNRHGHISGERLSSDSIGKIIKVRVYNGLMGQGESEADAKEAVRQFSGHSLRSGFVTTAYEKGIPEAAIMPHTRHKKAETLHKYRRMATLFKDNPSTMVGL